MTRLGAFYHLSTLLTGFDDLPVKTSEGYYAKLSIVDGYTEHLESLITLAINLFDVVELMKYTSDEQKICCKGIVFLWYTSECLTWTSAKNNILDKNRENNPTEEEYYSALLWRAIRAHPPALSGGYYGYWKYEPEN